MWPSHVHRWSEATADGGCGASSTVLDGEYEHDVQEREAKLMALLVRSEGAERGEKWPRHRRARSSAMAVARSSAEQSGAREPQSE